MTNCQPGKILQGLLLMFNNTNVRRSTTTIQREIEMHQVEQNITGAGNTVIIGMDFPINGFQTVAADDLTDSTQYIKNEYPSLKRLVSISSSASQAVEAAFKTASGLYDPLSGKITDNVYQLNRSDVALLVLKNEMTEGNFIKAAYELARDTIRAWQGVLDSRC